MSVTFLMVYHRDNSCVRTTVDMEPMLERAVLQYLAVGEFAFADEAGRDALLTLRLIDGRTYKCLTSSIYSWMISTPEGRRISNEIEAEIEAEKTPVPTDASADTLIATP